MDLSIEIGKLKLRNPVMTASGTFGYGEEYSEFIDLNRLGAVVVKGSLFCPKKEILRPELWRRQGECSMPRPPEPSGSSALFRRNSPSSSSSILPVIVNFFGDSVEEYAKAAERLSTSEGIHGLEMNISCPNKQAGWCIFGTDPG